MKEKQYIHRICPCHNYDIEGIQTWLEDMAKEGWILEKNGYGLCTFSFQRGKPIRLRYRLEVLFEGKRSYDERLAYLDLIKNSGWSRIAEFQGFDIFCTEDPNARELSTDPQIQASTLTKLRHRQRNCYLFLLFYVIFLHSIRSPSLIFPFRNAVTFGPLATGFMLCFVLYVFIIPLIDILRIRKAEKKLKSGVLLNQRKEWKPRAAWHRFCKTVPVFLCITTICAWIGGLFMVANRQDMAVDSPDPPFVTLRDLSDGSYKLTDHPLDKRNYYVIWSNSVAPVNYEWREYARITADDTRNTGYLIVEYHETISEWFAQGLADDYHLYQTSRFPDWEELDVPNTGLDEVRLIGTHGSYDIIIRHDNIMIYASYFQWSDGAVPDWQIWLEAMAEWLLNASE